MSEESELDKFFGPRTDAVIQNKWILQPTFDAKTLVEETRPIFKEGLELLYKQPNIPGFQTTISQIEVLYPWILEKTKLLARPLRQRSYFDEADTATTIGDALHRADILFNLITDRIPGRRVVEVLPNYKPEEIGLYQEVLENIELPPKIGREELEEVLIRAWEKFHQMQGILPPGQLPLISGFRFINPVTKGEIFYGDKVRELGILLAKAWAQEAIRPEPISWEFRPDAFTQREVAVALNFAAFKLQFIGRLDSISRLRRTSEKVDCQIIDIKTGQKISQNGLASDIEIRQGQAMRIMAERFTARFLRGYKSLLLTPQREAFRFSVKTEPGTRVHKERLNMAGYRRFNKEDGTMEIEPISMSEEEREDFNHWLFWYGAMIHKFRPELETLRKRFKKAKLQYDLRDL